MGKHLAYHAKAHVDCSSAGRLTTALFRWAAATVRGEKTRPQHWTPVPSGGNVIEDSGPPGGDVIERTGEFLSYGPRHALEHGR